MNHPVKAVAAAILLALMAAPIQAQTTTETPTPAPAPASETPVAPEAEAAATPDGTDPVIGSTYVKDNFGDWQMRCVNMPDGEKDPCQLYQLLNDESDNAVAEISIFALAPGQKAAAGGTIVTPLETLLTQQLRVSVDNGKAQVYPFSWCSQIGCFSRVGFTAEDIATFKRGSSAQLTIVPVAAPDKTVDLKISLSGFTAGYDAIDAWNKTEN